MSDELDRSSADAAAAKARVGAKLGEIWWAILLRGVLALGLAICAFIWPEKTVDIFVKLLGVYFLIEGVICAISAYRGGDKASPLLQAIISLAIGLILLLWSGVSAKLFLILVGVWLALQGIGLFLAAKNLDSAEGERNATMAIGVILALIGIVFVFWPETGVVAISWLIGIGALIIGCSLVYLATRVKRLQRHIKTTNQLT